GFVISGAGGFVGVAGAVSVWSVGSTLERNYSDTNSNGTNKSTANALDREKEDHSHDTADNDAATQGHNASGQVGGQVGDFKDTGSKSGQRMAGITDAGSGAITTNAPTAADVTG